MGSLFFWQGAGEFTDRVAFPVGIFGVVPARLEGEDLLEDLQIVRNREAVARVFVAEKVVEIVET